MPFPPAIAIPVSEPGQVGEARRALTRLATDAGLSADDCARIGLIATELGTNLVKHARHGELLARTRLNEGGPGVVIHSIDRGPGMRNLQECMQDGFSSAGSSGIGLGTLRRQADTLDIYTLEKTGTVIAITVGVGNAPRPRLHPLEIGLIIAPAPGEILCGDAIVVTRHNHATTFTAVDGLGHGPNAADAACEAVRIAREHPAAEPGQLLALIHSALRKTRGAAVAIARIDSQSRLLSFCGVGNIAAALVRHGGSKTLPASNGIVGHIMPRTESITLPWSGKELLVMHSDGLHAHSATYSQPGLLVRPASLIAGMLYGQQKRGRDDASVLVVREHSP